MDNLSFEEIKSKFSSNKKFKIADETVSECLISDFQRFDYFLKK